MFYQLLFKQGIYSSKASIQARQKMSGHKPLAAKQNTIVTRVASKVPPYNGTAISKEFVAERLQSSFRKNQHISQAWEQHLVD